MGFWISFLVVGLIAGWFAGEIKKGGGFGLVGNLIVGVAGAFVGGTFAGLIGLTSEGLVPALATATVGAVVLLFVVYLLKRAEHG